jgi:hypothetical protein
MRWWCGVEQDGCVISWSEASGEVSSSSGSWLNDFRSLPLQTVLQGSSFTAVKRYRVRIKNG